MHEKLKSSLLLHHHQEEAVEQTSAVEICVEVSWGQQNAASPHSENKAQVNSSSWTTPAQSQQAADVKHLLLCEAAGDSQISQTSSWTHRCLNQSASFESLVAAVGVVYMWWPARGGGTVSSLFPPEVSIAAVASVLTELESLFHYKKSKERHTRLFSRLKTDFTRVWFINWNHSPSIDLIGWS